MKDTLSVHACVHHAVMRHYLVLAACRLCQLRKCVCSTPPDLRNWMHRKQYIPNSRLECLLMRLQRQQIHFALHSTRTTQAKGMVRKATAGYLISFGPIEKYIMLFVTPVCARKPGAASQAFERMHNTMSHRVTACVPSDSK